MTKKQTSVEGERQVVIPLRSAIAVLITLAIAFWLAFVTARANIEEIFERELRAGVATLAPTISGDLHDLIDEISFRLDPEEFEFIRTKLEIAVNGLDLGGEESSIYTLRRAPDYDRTGELLFVVMDKVDPETGEFFVGNRYKAQPFQLLAFEGQLSSSGLYEDSEGTWISAAAPIAREDGTVVGIVQADHRVTTYNARLRESLLPILVVSLVTILTFGLFVYRSAGLVRLVTKRGNDAQEALEELEQAKDKLVESEKLASLGQLVGGLAHELNTPIGIATTANSVVDERLKVLNQAVADKTLKRSMLVDELNRLSEGAELSEKSLQRAAQLIERFKAISATQDRADIVVFEVGDLMREVRDRVRAQEDWRDYDIEWVVDCLEPIEVSQRLGIFRSVLMEVVENALIHGLADHKKGQIVLRALRKESRCYIQIQDLGRGISAENLGKVLEPFFTTERGRGRIGLGLTEVFNLIAFQLGGTLSIDGSEGSGCIVSIELPTSLLEAG